MTKISAKIYAPEPDPTPVLLDRAKIYAPEPDPPPKRVLLDLPMEDAQRLMSLVTHTPIATSIRTYLDSSNKDSGPLTGLPGAIWHALCEAGVVESRYPR